MLLEDFKQELLTKNREMIQTDTVSLNYQLRLEGTAQLKELIRSVGQVAQLDEERLERRVKVAVNSVYGRIPGLTNLLISILLFPSDGEDYTGIQEKQTEILEKFPQLSLELAQDIKTAKGYNTFLSDDYEVIEGQEPDFEEYEMLIRILANTLKIPVIDLKLTPEKWQQLEVKAIEKAKADLLVAEAELAKFKQMNGAK